MLMKTTRFLAGWGVFERKEVAFSRHDELTYVMTS